MNTLTPILYTIKPGDTLYSIALRYGTTVQELLNTNLGIDPFSLRIGQNIYIYPRYNTNITNNEQHFVSNSQLNLLTDMNLAWLEHTFWTRQILISIAEELDDLEATKARLLENPKDVADVFRRFYGNNVANTIQNLLTEHLVIGAELITALKDENQVLAQELNTRWYKNAEDMANAFSSINPNYSRNEVLHMLNEHLRLVTDEVAARLKEDYVADIKAHDIVQKEILKMADFFVNGIVRQFPNLF